MGPLPPWLEGSLLEGREQEVEALVLERLKALMGSHLSTVALLVEVQTEQAEGRQVRLVDQQFMLVEAAVPVEAFRQGTLNLLVVQEGLVELTEQAAAEPQEP